MKRLIIYFVVFLILLPVVSSGFIGISPASYEIDFEPNLKKNFSFKVSSSSEDQKIQIYVKGDLAKYVNLSQEILIGGGILEVTLSLPEKIEKPGEHRIFIGAKEIEKDIDSTIGGIAAIQAPIKVRVPYPGKYIETQFSISDINEGEFMPYELLINNFGTDGLKIKPRIEFYEKEKKIKTEILDETFIKSGDELLFKGFIDTSKFTPGIYNVKAIIDYGEKIEIEKLFKIGSKTIEIVNYSNRFIPWKINKFEIEIKSLWNSEMKGVYGKVSVTNKGIVLDNFATASIDLMPWQKTTLIGYFDAENISDGKYNAGINIFYENESTYKLVVIRVKEISETNYIKIVLIAGGILFAVIGIIITYLIFKIKRLNKNAKKKTKKKN